VTFSVTDRKEDQEMYVLRSFYEFLRQHTDARLLHWNMNSSDYGFQALEIGLFSWVGLVPSSILRSGDSILTI
jgi:hypothetical protein